MTDTHLIERTNAKGQPGVGRCLKCGAEGLPMDKRPGLCPNPEGMTRNEALLRAFGSPETWSERYGDE